MYRVVEDKGNGIYTILDVINRGVCCCDKKTLRALVQKGAYVEGYDKSTDSVTELYTSGHVRETKSLVICENLTCVDADTIIKGINIREYPRADVTPKGAKRFDTVEISIYIKGELKEVFKGIQYKYDEFVVIRKTDGSEEYAPMSLYVNDVLIRYYTDCSIVLKEYSEEDTKILNDLLNIYIQQMDLVDEGKVLLKEHLDEVEKKQLEIRQIDDIYREKACNIREKRIEKDIEFDDIVINTQYLNIKGDELCCYVRSYFTGPRTEYQVDKLYMTAVMKRTNREFFYTYNGSGKKKSITKEHAIYLMYSCTFIYIDALNPDYIVFHEQVEED